VDNASTDGSAEMVRAQFPNARLIVNESRQGFAQNHNQVLRRAQGRYWLILNEDTYLVNDAVDQMAAFMDQHPEAGGVNCRILNPDGSLQDSCFLRPAVLSAALTALPGRARWPPWMQGRYPPQRYAAPFEPDCFRGACFMVRAAAMQQVGLFDERFLIFYEETDLCLRLKRDGWHLFYLPEPTIVHYGSATTTQPDLRHRMFVQMYISRYLYFEKYHARPAVTFLRAVDGIGLLLRLVGHRLRAGTGTGEGELSPFLRAAARYALLGRR